MEKRTFEHAPELRAKGDKKKAVGYAAVFNQSTRIGSWFDEVIAPGAFASAISDGDIRALINHDTGRIIGRTTAGTLILTEDETGLRAEIDLPDTTDGRDLAVSLDRGDITGMSFGFSIVREEWDESGDMPKRTILEANLFEVSPVTFPAYEGTDIAMRSLERSRKTHNFEAVRRRLKMNLDVRERE